MNEQCHWDRGDCSGTCTGLVYDGVESQCFLAQLGDGSCDVNCLSEDCNFDYRDCECDTVLTDRAGYHANGVTTGADYENEQRLCWLVRPKLSSGKPSESGVESISLSFRRFDTEEKFDRLRIFDGHNVISPMLSPDEGFSGELHGGKLPKVPSTDV